MEDESVMERALGKRKRRVAGPPRKAACAPRPSFRSVRRGQRERMSVVHGSSMIAGRPAARARFALAALLLLVLAPARATAEKAPYWIVPGGGISWLPND